MEEKVPMEDGIETNEELMANIVAVVKFKMDGLAIYGECQREEYQKVMEQ